MYECKNVTSELCLIETTAQSSFTRNILLKRIRLCTVGVRKTNVLLDKAVVKAERALSLRSGDMNRKHLPVPGYTICDKVYEHSQTNEHGMHTSADGEKEEFVAISDCLST
jgi:hypothetical protein